MLTTQTATASPSSLADLFAAGDLFGSLDHSAKTLEAAAAHLTTFLDTLDRVTGKVRDEKGRILNLLDKLPTLDSAGASVNSPFARALGIDAAADALAEARATLYRHHEALDLIESVSMGQAGSVKALRDTLLSSSLPPAPAPQEKEEEVIDARPTVPAPSTNGTAHPVEPASPPLIKCERCEALFSGEAVEGRCSNCARQAAQPAAPEVPGSLEVPEVLEPASIVEEITGPPAPVAVAANPAASPAPTGTLFPDTDSEKKEDAQEEKPGKKPARRRRSATLQSGIQNGGAA